MSKVPILFIWSWQLSQSVALAIIICSSVELDSVLHQLARKCQEQGGGGWTVNATREEDWTMLTTYVQRDGSTKDWGAACGNPEQVIQVKTFVGPGAPLLSLDGLGTWNSCKLNCLWHRDASFRSSAMLNPQLSELLKIHGEVVSK